MASLVLPNCWSTEHNLWLPLNCWEMGCWALIKNITNSTMRSWSSCSWTNNDIKVLSNLSSSDCSPDSTWFIWLISYSPDLSAWNNKTKSLIQFLLISLFLNINICTIWAKWSRRFSKSLHSTATEVINFIDWDATKSFDESIDLAIRVFISCWFE